MLRVTIRPRIAADDPEWARMRCALWPDLATLACPGDMAAWLRRVDTAVIVAARAGGGLCGFAEVGSRSIADGCDSTPVAYLEGWYVDSDSRRQGVGAALVRAAMAWAQTHGYRELASDAELGNLDSQRAHAALGFVEVGRAVLFVKPL
jgi:aminoglycoside 6'-N-acetyltransferase I